MRLQLGVRGHDISRDNIENLANKLEKERFPHIQLALNKALEDFGNFQDKMSVGLMEHLKDVLNNSGVKVSVLGCYINMGQPNYLKRRKEIEYFKEHIRYASSIGCKIVGTETGCLTEDYTYTQLNESPEAFDIFINTLKELVTEAEKFGIFVAIEPVTVHIINTPLKLKKVLDLINSNNLQVILDPVNLIDAYNYENQDNILRECFELFANKINAIHINDFIIDNNHKKVVTVGKGQLNYKLLMSLIKKYRPYVNLLLENYEIGTKEEIENYLNKFI